MLLGPHDRPAGIILGDQEACGGHQAYERDGMISKERRKVENCTNPLSVDYPLLTIGTAERVFQLYEKIWK